jgi:hypothetical protein
VLQANRARQILRSGLKGAAGFDFIHVSNIKVERVVVFIAGVTDQGPRGGAFNFKSRCGPS